MFHVPKYKLFLAAMDYVLILLSFLVSHAVYVLYFHHYRLNYSWYHYVSLSPSFIITIIIFPAIYVTAFQYCNLYKINVMLTKSLQLTSMIRAMLYGISILIGYSIFIKFTLIKDSRSFVLIFSSVSFIIVALNRLIILRKFYFKKLMKNILRRRAVIIGAGESGKMLATKLNFEEEYGIELIGFLDDKIEANKEIIYGLRVLGKISDLKNISDDKKLDEAFVAVNNIEYEHLIYVLEKCKDSGIYIRLASNLFDVIHQNINVESYGGIPVIDFSPKMNRKFSLILKKLFDISFSFLGLVIVSPLFLIIAVLIKISSKGPVFYKDSRIGKKGKQFEFYKFRSMHISHDGDKERKEEMLKFMNGEVKNGSEETKVINDKRLTLIGRFIRRTSIDELPQLINVLKGDMSLVGPRPCLQYEYDNMENWQKKRFEVIPGCTGVWQVFGRSKVSFQDSIILDLYYINNMSPWLDMQLIFKTVPVMLFSRGGK